MKGDPKYLTCAASCPTSSTPLRGADGLAGCGWTIPSRSATAWEQGLSCDRRACWRPSRIPARPAHAARVLGAGARDGDDRPWRDADPHRGRHPRHRQGDPVRPGAVALVVSGVISSSGTPGTRVGQLESWVPRVAATGPEADGTLSWDATTIVVVRPRRRPHGIGFFYAALLRGLVADKLGAVVEGADPMNVRASSDGMLRVVRNLGRVGFMCAMAVSTVDCALWGAGGAPAGRPTGVPARRSPEFVPVYGSSELHHLYRRAAGPSRDHRSGDDHGIGAVKIRSDRSRAGRRRRAGGVGWPSARSPG